MLSFKHYQQPFRVNCQMSALPALCGLIEDLHSLPVCEEFVTKCKYLPVRVIHALEPLGNCVFFQSTCQPAPKSKSPPIITRRTICHSAANTLEGLWGLSGLNVICFSGLALNGDLDEGMSRNETSKSKRNPRMGTCNLLFQTPSLLYSLTHPYRTS